MSFYIVIVSAILFSWSSAQIWNCQWPFYWFQTKQYGLIASRCADEGQRCEFPIGTTYNLVFYGAAASWERTIFVGNWGSVECTNNRQGCDPLPGIRKYCHLIHEHTLRRAGEISRRRLAEWDNLSIEEQNELVNELFAMQEEHASPFERVFHGQIEEEEDSDSANELLVGLERIGVLGLAEENESCSDGNHCADGLFCCSNQCVPALYDWSGYRECPEQCRGGPQCEAGTCFGKDADLNVLYPRSMEQECTDSCQCQSGCCVEGKCSNECGMDDLNVLKKAATKVYYHDPYERRYD